MHQISVISQLEIGMEQQVSLVESLESPDSTDMRLGYVLAIPGPRLVFPDVVKVNRVAILNTKDPKGNRA